MKAIILAAGKGKRFGEITKKIPKPLIKLGDKTLIEHNILLLKDNGINDIVINVSYLSDLIINFLGDGQKYGVKINYSIEKPEPYETGGGIQYALPILGNKPFLVLNSDIYTNFRLSDLSLNENDLASLVMVKNPAHNKYGDFSFNDGRLQNSNENMMTYSGIGIYDPKIFNNKEFSKYKLIDLLVENIRKNKVSAVAHDGIWFDIGDKKKLNIAEKLFS